jgi:hypothetical protein
MVTDVPRRPATVYRAQKPERWVRMVIRAWSRDTWSPRRRHWPWRPVTRRPAASGLGPSQPLLAGHRELTGSGYRPAGDIEANPQSVAGFGQIP